MAQEVFGMTPALVDMGLISLPSDKAVQHFVFSGSDYKQKKPRLRPGLKKKILHSLNAEIYTLTCRYRGCKLHVNTVISVKSEVKEPLTQFHVSYRMK